MTDGGGSNVSRGPLCETEETNRTHHLSFRVPRWKSSNSSMIALDDFSPWTERKVKEACEWSFKRADEGLGR